MYFILLLQPIHPSVLSNLYSSLLSLHQISLYPCFISSQVLDFLFSLLAYLILFLKYSDCSSNELFLILLFIFFSFYFGFGPMQNSELKRSPAQDAVIRVHSRITDVEAEKFSTVSARLLVPKQQIGCLLGKGGNIIAEMRRATGASIKILVNEHVPKCAAPNDDVVQVLNNSYTE